MAVTHKPIFFLPDGAFCTFRMFPSGSDGGVVAPYIHLTGGSLLTNNDDDPYAIVIMDYKYIAEHNDEFNLPRDRDYFIPTFLLDSYKAGKMLDLNNYRYGPSAFEDYDANDILTRKKSWTELMPKLPMSSLSINNPKETSSSEHDIYSWFKWMTTWMPYRGESNASNNNFSQGDSSSKPIIAIVVDSDDDSSDDDSTKSFVTAQEGDAMDVEGSFEADDTQYRRFDREESATTEPADYDGLAEDQTENYFGDNESSQTTQGF